MRAPAACLDGWIASAADADVAADVAVCFVCCLLVCLVLSQSPVFAKTDDVNSVRRQQPQ